VNRLYQWFSRRASLSHFEKTGEGPRRTIRTEVTVEWESTTFLGAGSPVVFDTCPLCGHKFSPHPLEQARLHLQEGVGPSRCPCGFFRNNKAPAGPTG
jgi:hypothetical protein